MIAAPRAIGGTLFGSLTGRVEQKVPENPVDRMEH